MRQYYRSRRSVVLCALCLLALAAGRSILAQNFQEGPFRMNLGFTAGADFRDNANLSENHPKADCLLTIGPTLSGGVYLPFSGGEQFTLSVAATYSHSLTGVQSDSFGAPLNATLVLPVYIAEWNVVMSDSFTYQNDALASTFAVDQSQLTEYSNIATMSATRQLGKFSTTFAAQRTDDWYPTQTTQNELDYQFSFTPAYYFREGYSIFLRSAYGISYLNDPTLRDSTGYSIALGLNGQITPSLNGTISLGWAETDLAATKTNGIDHIDGVSALAAVSYSHPLRPNTTHTISVFHDPGVALELKDSSITEVTGVNYTISQRLNRYMTLSPSVGWTHLESLSGSSEIADLIVVGISLQRQITRKLSGTFAYRYQTRSSNLAGQSYDVNELQASFNYTF